MDNPTTGPHAPNTAVVKIDLRTIPKLSDFRLLQASGEISYRFDELGLEIEGPWSAGAFNGTARVTYWNDAEGLEWFIHEIYLDCSRWNGQSWDAKTIEIDAACHQPLYTAIWSALTDGAYKDSIEAAVEADL